MKVIINPIDVGKAFAHDSDENQANLINSLASELAVACRDSHSFEMQCCYMSDKFSKNGIQLIKDLHEFIVLRENNPSIKE